MDSFDFSQRVSWPISFELSSPNKTSALAKSFSKTLLGGEIIFLIGNLGTGKTFFTQSLLHSLGVKEVVQSPTYILHRKYEIPHKNIKIAHHFDLYRVKEPSELQTLLYAELFTPTSIAIVEWPEISREFFESVSPISITFKQTGQLSRNITFEIL